jgi:hypothetical protein
MPNFSAVVGVHCKYDMYLFRPMTTGKISKRAMMTRFYHKSFVIIFLCDGN